MSTLARLSRRAGQAGRAIGPFTLCCLALSALLLCLSTAAIIGG
jgi:hypothetical protein